jgi:hypothetical protein
VFVPSSELAPLAPPSFLQASVPPPPPPGIKGGGGGEQNACLRVRGLGEPIQAIGEKTWHSVYISLTTHWLSTYSIREVVTLIFQAKIFTQALTLTWTQCVQNSLSVDSVLRIIYPLKIFFSETEEIFRNVTQIPLPTTTDAEET